MAGALLWKAPVAALWLRCLWRRVPDESHNRRKTDHFLPWVHDR